MQSFDYVSGRRYGLDWLRIIAFGLLIFYHIGMFFVPWGWHVKTAEPVEWLIYPMLALNPWRLSLLFVISGVASRMLMSKLGSRERFIGERSWRLLLPLLAGMILFVAPQPWAELRDQAGYGKGFWEFYATAYFDFGRTHGMILPTWNHLWFVAYLWAYTVVLALLSLLPAKLRTIAQSLFDRVFGGWRLFVLPVLYLWAMRMTLFPIFEETHTLIDDVYAHSLYGFAFFFGVGLARSQKLWETAVAHWKAAAVAAVAGYAVLAGANILWPGDTPSPDWATPLFRVGRSVQAWCSIIALLGMSQVFLHRDGPVRRYLTEAMFPYYIAHQTIIVLAGLWLKPLQLGAAAEFAIIAAVTLAGCALTYELARRIGWLRPFLGLKPAGSRRRPSRVGEEPELVLPR